MNKKPVIGCDVDGVIADFFGQFLTFVNQETGHSLQYDDCESHNLAEAFDMPVLEMKKLQLRYETANNIVELPPFSQAIESLTLLSDRYEIAIITSRKSELEDATRLWFARHFPNVDIHYSIGRNNPFAGGDGRLYKPQVAEMIGAICLIEDNEQEFIHWDSDIVKPICFAQPWNRCLAETHPHIPRLNWPEIIELLLA